MICITPPSALLDVVDILPVQLENLRSKLPTDWRVALLRGDASSLASADAQYDQVLLFFLLHEMPDDVRRATLGEAMRVLKPGGKLVIVDYHRPVRLHPLRPLMRQVFRHLEPYAFDLWNHEIAHFIPSGIEPATILKRSFFGGLYQKLVLSVVAAMKRSNAPIFWLLFGAGGMLSALLGPMLVFITGLAVPFGWPLGTDLMAYPRMLALAQNWAGKSFFFVVIALFAWHAAHRILHSLHDIGIHAGTTAKLACYGAALVVTLAVATSLLAIGF